MLHIVTYVTGAYRYKCIGFLWNKCHAFKPIRLQHDCVIQTTLQQWTEAELALNADPGLVPQFRVRGQWTTDSYTK